MYSIQYTPVLRQYTLGLGQDTLVYLLMSDIMDDGLVLMGEAVVGVSTGPLEDVCVVGADDENSSHAEMTRRL